MSQRVDMPWGYVLFGEPGKNEVTIVNTQYGDPPGLRFVSPDGNCGKWSFCVGADPAIAVEVFLFQGKKDERTRGRDDVHYGEGTIHVKGPARFPGDDGMLPIALFLHDYVWIKGINGMSPTKPELVLPPIVVTPPPPPPPPPPSNLEERQRWVAAIRNEFAVLDSTFEVDEGHVQAYLQGRSTAADLHGNCVERLGTHKPELHPPGAPY